MAQYVLGHLIMIGPARANTNPTMVGCERIRSAAPVVQQCKVELDKGKQAVYKMR